MAGMLVDNSGQPLDGTTTGGDTDPALLGWDPAELFFHTRATLGRHDHDFGATYPLGETGRFPPVVKPPAPGPAIELYRPTGDDGPGLVETIEAPHGSGYLAVDPVSDRELGTLLYRTARVRSTTVGDPHSAAAASDRPYSSPGRSYELEIYATVHHCDGVPRGSTTTTPPVTGWNPWPSPGPRPTRCWRPAGWRPTSAACPGCCCP